MSSLDDLVSDIAARYADATVSFEAGGLQKSRHGQRRRVIFTRTSGKVEPSTGRDRLTPLAAPTPPATWKWRRFARREQIEVTLRAESEDALDLVFDRLIDAIFSVMGPNAVMSEYSWVFEDSTAGAATARTPAIKFALEVMIKSTPPNYGPVGEIEIAQGTLEISGGPTDPVVTIVP